MTTSGRQDSFGLMLLQLAGHAHDLGTGPGCWPMLTVRPAARDGLHGAPGSLPMAQIRVPMDDELALVV